MRGMNCPNCGAPYNPAKFVCESCGSFVIMSDANQYNVPNQAIHNISEGMKQTSANHAAAYPGTYVFGKLLGAGEIPIRLGSANYYTSALFSSGGKLLLTSSSLYFSSHMFNQGKTDLCLPLTEISQIKHDRNQIVSDQISVYAGKSRYKFVVFGGKEWVTQIQTAKDNPAIYQESAKSEDHQQVFDYTDELIKLKKLLDAGIITEEEFTIKKRMLMGI